MSAPDSKRPVLGARLVDAGLITPEQLDEGLRAQAVYGGRLGTNLVELGFVEEQTLVGFLAEQHRVPAMDTSITPDPSALGAVPAVICDELNCLPLLIDQGALVVATSNPSQPGLRRRLQEGSGWPVHLVIALEGRLYALMREALGIERPLRYAVVMAEAERAGHADPSQTHVRSILRDRAFDAGALPTVVGEDLEEIMLLEEIAEQSSLGEADDDEVLELTAVVDDDQAAMDFDIHTAEINFQPADLPDVDPAVQETHARLDEELQPLSFQEALPALMECEDREAVATVLLRHALWTHRRALLFTVQRGLVLGWHGLGDRMDRDLAAKLMIPVSAPSVFQQVYESRRAYQGPLENAPLNRLFVQILGGEWPDACHLAPFVVGRQVVGMLYADGAIGQLAAAPVGEIDLLASQVRRAYQRFMAQSGAASK